MDKLYRSYFLQPLLIILYFFTMLTMTVVGGLFFSPDTMDDPDNVPAAITSVITFSILYTLVFLPFNRFGKFAKSLDLAEQEYFLENLRYDPVMKIWCSGRYLIKKSLEVIDSCKVVWIHDLKEDNIIGITGIPAIVPIFATSMLIYQYGTVVKPVYPLGIKEKPVFALSFLKRKGRPRCGQIMQYISQYNSNILLGYTKENVDIMNKKYNAGFNYTV